MKLFLSIKTLISPRMQLSNSWEKFLMATKRCLSLRRLMFRLQLKSLYQLKYHVPSTPRLGSSLIGSRPYLYLSWIYSNNLLFSQSKIILIPSNISNHAFIPQSSGCSAHEEISPHNLQDGKRPFQCI